MSRRWGFGSPKYNEALKKTLERHCQKEGGLLEQYNSAIEKAFDEGYSAASYVIYEEAQALLNIAHLTQVDTPDGN